MRVYAVLKVAGIDCVGGMDGNVCGSECTSDDGVAKDEEDKGKIREDLGMIALLAAFDARGG